MIRTFLYFILLAVVAAGFAWFADNPGSLTIHWRGYEIETSVYIAAITLTIAMGVILAAVWLLAYLFSGPRRMAMALRRRRERRGLDALRQGIYAVGSGDQWRAEKFAREARKALPNEPLTKLLRAQAAQMSGDRASARVIFETMLDEQETSLLGLRGLFLEARRENEAEVAMQFAQQALAISPSLAWPATALFELQCQANDWNGALNTLAIQRQYRHIDRKTADRRRAVLLTAEAIRLEESYPGKAAELAVEAHKLAPGLVPAASVAGRTLAAQGKAKKATRIIATAWQRSPHPDLAACYAYVRPGDSPRDRLIRVKALASLNADHMESRLALAAAAVDAHEWEEARGALEPLVRNGPTGKICALMARIESGQHHDAGRVREWMARAIRAPRDAMWVADGVAAEHWAPVSPVSGALDAFVWAVPPEETSSRVGVALIAGIAAMERELEHLNAPATPLVEAPAAPSPVEDADVVETVGAAGPAAHAAPAGKGAVVPASPLVPAPVADSVEAVPARAAASAVETASEEAPPAKPAAAPASEAVAAAAEVVVEARQEAETATQRKAREMRGRTEPKIFVPDRPPDDPGPDGDATEDPISDPMSPLTRYRMPLKG